MSEEPTAGKPRDPNTARQFRRLLDWYAQQHHEGPGWQRAVGKLMGLRQPDVSALRAGKRNAGLQLAHRVAKRIGLDPHWFETDDQDPTPHFLCGPRRQPGNRYQRTRELNDFGKRLRGLIEQSPRFKTRSEFLKATGLSHPTLYRYETTPRRPRADALRAMAEALGVTIDALLGHEAGPQALQPTESEEQLRGRIILIEAWIAGRCGVDAVDEMRAAVDRALDGQWPTPAADA